MKTYLFHNVYGDSDDLIASKPGWVECVPFGWSAEAEEYRNSILLGLNVSVSGLPSVVSTRDGKNVVLDLRLVQQPWSWDSIISTIDEMATSSAAQEMNEEQNGD